MRLMKNLHNIKAHVLQHRPAVSRALNRIKRFLAETFILLIFTIILFTISLVIMEKIVGVIFPNDAQYYTSLLDSSTLQKSNDPNLLFNNVANLNTTDDLGNILTHNSRGMRTTKEFKTNKEYNYRILVLGDSITWGAYVNESEIYTEILSGLLNEKKCCFEVMNAGVGGYNTLQELEYLKAEGLDYSPDIVIVQMDYTDLWNSDIKEENGTTYVGNSRVVFPIMIKLPVEMENWLGRNSRVYQLSNIGIYKLLKVNSTSKIELFDSSYMKTLHSIKYIKSITESRNISLLFLLSPSLREERNIEDEIIIKTLVELNISNIDMYPFFKEKGMETLIARPDDYAHPNALGHRIIAERIFSWIQAEI